MTLLAFVLYSGPEITFFLKLVDRKDSSHFPQIFYERLICLLRKMRVLDIPIPTCSLLFIERVQSLCCNAFLRLSISNWACVRL